MCSSFWITAQEFTLADTLRGTLSPIRSCFDVTYYNLELKVDVENHSIAGVNHIRLKNVTDFDSIQIDLFENMVIDSILHGAQKLKYHRLLNAVFVSFPSTQKEGDENSLSIYYHGTPVVAKNAPWDGGFVWSKDEHQKPWVGVACEGLGASLWWPNKDHLSDEPDSMRISCTVPFGLMCVSNGELETRFKNEEGETWVWKVSYPINNYNVTLNIADYAHIQDYYLRNEKDSLKLDYYVLRHNVEKAKVHFKQVHEMMACFEQAFGAYPFSKDGYALVETPYLGMEHQGAIAYGNQYLLGYKGRFPEGIDFDYIIVHESGHEWWGNSVSMKDVADMWLHESFCTYAESVFVECKYGYDKMLQYLKYQRNFIGNGSPIFGTYGLNKKGDNRDMYYKGAWMIHTLRSVINDDDRFRSILKGIVQDFAYKTIDGHEVINYVNEKSGKNLTSFFNQYLRQKEIPVLIYKTRGKMLQLRWKAAEYEFEMPVEFTIPSKG
ncbi:M1 family metallopeptidase, partial [Bacteroidota bacterium]